MPCSVQALCEVCSQPCDCPAESPLCPVGTSLVLDGCSCCKVCARQAGEPCSFLEPCDYHKDLYCDYGMLSDTETGICMGECNVAFWKVIECYVKRREFKCFGCIALHFLSTSRSLIVLGSFLMAFACVTAQEGQTCDLGGVIYRSGETVSAQLQTSLCLHEWGDWLRADLCQQHTAALS